METFLSYLKKLGQWIKYWIWVKPVSRPEPLKASEVASLYVVIDYKGQKINLLRTEVPRFMALSRKEKRAMATRMGVMEKKKQLIFVEINGQTVAVKNKDYAAQADIRQLRADQIRQGKRPYKT